MPTGRRALMTSESNATAALCMGVAYKNNAPSVGSVPFFALSFIVGVI